MHTQLKGRIFNSQGVSYLVLHEQNGSPDWLQVKALNRERVVRQMQADEIRRHLGHPAKA